jgi:hypothetical protein
MALGTISSAFSSGLPSSFPFPTTAAVRVAVLSTIFSSDPPVPAFSPTRRNRTLSSRGGGEFVRFMGTRKTTFSCASSMSSTGPSRVASTETEMRME